MLTDNIIYLEKNQICERESILQPFVICKQLFVNET